MTKVTLAFVSAFVISASVGISLVFTQTTRAAASTSSVVVPAGAPKLVPTALSPAGS